MGFAVADATHQHNESTKAAKLQMFIVCGAILLIDN